MRQGKLLAENSPKSLLAYCECTSLEDAFLSLSVQQEMGQETNISSGQVRNNIFYFTFLC